MSIGSKIKELRDANRMSLDDVAKMCQTTRQTIYKYENGIVTNIPYDRIISLSKALKTTPAVLLGLNQGDERNKNSLDGLALTEGEELMLELFRQIPTDKQAAALEMLKAALKMQ